MVGTCCVSEENEKDAKNRDPAPSCCSCCRRYSRSSATPPHESHASAPAPSPFLARREEKSNEAPREEAREEEMERAAPVRSSHTSTADLLAWPQPQGPAAAATPSPPRRPGQPSEAIRKVVFGGQVTAEEADSLTKRKPCSAPKWKEMTGSGIFAAGSNGDAGEAAAAAVKPARAASRQAISTVSHISFAEDGTDPPKKPTSVAEVAKQRELSGTLQSDADSKLKKQISNAKSKELSGHDIFADTPDSRNRARSSSNGSTASHTPVKNANASTFSFGEANTDSALKTAKKITGKKVNDLSGNDIFKGEAPPASAEKHLSTAKLKEITGSNIFAAGKEPIRERVPGNRKPPGGESSIALI